MTLPLLPYEVDLLYWLHSLHTPIGDAFMYLISGAGAWLPIGVCLVVYLGYRKPWREVLLLLAGVALCVLICDQVSSSIAKPLFARPRPTHYEGIAEHLQLVYNYRGGLYGFFSSHAANFTAVAWLLASQLRSRRFSVMMVLLIGLVCLSRIYIGAHFLSDVLAGITLGLVVGVGVSSLVCYLRRYLPTGGIPVEVLYRPGRIALERSLYWVIPLLMVGAVQIVVILGRL